MEREIDKKILNIYDDLSSKLDLKEKELIHFKSVSNFIYYLIYYPEINPKKNRKLQELGEFRMKKKLYEYLKLVKGKELNKEKSAIYFKEYIYEIGDFMMEYYKFSGNGGKLKLLTILVVLTIGAIFDFFANLIFDIKIPTLFTPAFLLIAIARMIIKYRNKKIYGMFY